MLRLSKNLPRRLRVLLAWTVVVAVTVVLVSLYAIFALASQGNPSIVPWVVMIAFGIAPIMCIQESFSAEMDEREKRSHEN